MDTHKRSVVKSVTWRIVGVIILGGITYLLTKDWKAMTGITLIFNVIRFVLYYWHERIWERIEWGKIRHPLEHLPVKADLTPEDHQVIWKFMEDKKLIHKQPEYQI